MRCTCRQIREGHDGTSFTFYLLGVLCPHCESAVADEEARAAWEALSPAEKTAAQIAARWDHARYVTLPRRRPDAPPF